MPLSRCPSCGFTCRALLQTSKPPRCPDCDGQMDYVRRAELTEGRRPSVVGSLNLMRWADRRRSPR